MAKKTADALKILDKMVGDDHEQRSSLRKQLSTAGSPK